MLVECRWDYIRDGSNLYKDMDRLTAFNKGLNTWASWVDQNVDPTQTKVFFQGISPTHYQWVKIPSYSMNYYYYSIDQKVNNNAYKVEVR